MPVGDSCTRPTTAMPMAASANSQADVVVHGSFLLVWARPVPAAQDCIDADRDRAAIAPRNAPCSVHRANAWGTKSFSMNARRRRSPISIPFSPCANAPIARILRVRPEGRIPPSRRMFELCTPPRTSMGARTRTEPAGPAAGAKIPGRPAQHRRAGHRQNAGRTRIGTCGRAGRPKPGQEPLGFPAADAESAHCAPLFWSQAKARRGTGFPAFHPECGRVRALFRRDHGTSWPDAVDHPVPRG